MTTFICRKTDIEEKKKTDLIPHEIIDMIILTQTSTTKSFHPANLKTQCPPLQFAACLLECELIYNNSWLICKETNHEASGVY